MKVIVTVDDIVESGYWEEFCDKHDINPYAVNEGMMNGDEEFALTYSEAQKYGFIKREE
jgi:hypothetical protein